MRWRFPKNPLAGFDLETYSPKGSPADFGDPMVSASLAIEDRGGLALSSLIYPPGKERRPLWMLLSSMDGLYGSLVTYNGPRFDPPYLAERLLLYGFPWEPALRRLGAYRLVERALNVPGAAHNKFFGFLGGRNGGPELYNLEGSICRLRILGKMAEAPAVRRKIGLGVNFKSKFGGKYILGGA